MVPPCAGLRWPRYQLPSAAWYTRYATLSKPRTGAPRVIALATFSWLPAIHWGCRVSTKPGWFAPLSGHKPGATALTWPRSEEHTSELQSRLHLVCRLLLEKKKKAPSSHTRYPV